MLLGQTPTQSPHAVHLSTSTTGSPVALMLMAPKVQACAQSASPRHPHVHPLPPPATAAAASQVERPRYSARWIATSVPPAHIRRATRLVASPASTPRKAAISSTRSAFDTVHLDGCTLPSTICSAKAWHPGRPHAPQLACGSMEATISMRGSSHTQSFLFAS